MSSSHRASTSGRRIVLTPSRDDLVDAGALAVLVVIALYGFSTTYAGSNYLIVGAVGLVLGLLIAHVANALKQPMIAVAAMAIATFFLLGGAVTLRGGTIAGILPSTQTFRDLADSSIHGWKDLLTTLPPVDASGTLLVLPYLIGLLAGVGGLCLASRVRWAIAPVLVPLAVLVAVILLGTQTPPARIVQGAVFGVIALGWSALRSARLRPVVHSGGGRMTRLSTAVALLAVTGASAWLVGPHVPGVGAHHRTVLRSYVVPPFDIGQYPSPLAAYRNYTEPAKQLYARTLFTIHGLDHGTPIRIATLDAYDGSTWRASNRRAESGIPASTFQRVGSTIDQPARGKHVTFTVTVDGAYSDVWLPDAGAMAGIDFHGTDAKSHADYFRLDLATGTGIVPDGVHSGDSYTVHAVLPPDPNLVAGDSVAVSGALPDDATSFLKTPAQRWSAAASGPTAKVLALVGYLRRFGKYSDGGKGAGFYLPGHSQFRLNQFVNGIGDSQIVGDDEQYAATLALMINQLGTPARVVLGATSYGTVVKGSNVHAWVEVQLDDGSWRAIPTDQFMNKNNPPNKQPPQRQQDLSANIVPPPARVRPRSSVDDAEAAGSRSSRRTPTQQPQNPSVDTGWSVPAWLITTAIWAGPPTGVIALLLASIVGLKAVRRRRRRSRGSPATRVARGWREIVDHARDLGATPAGRTRREQATALDQHGLAGLAFAADARVFGPLEPMDDAATGYWRDVDEARKRMSASVGRGRRWRGAVSIASLRRQSGASA